jgi:FMN phosphatase YigB (HAD superfamily)
MKKSIVFDFYNVMYNPEKGELDEDVLKAISSFYEKGYPLYLFTSSSASTVERLNKENNFLRYFTEQIYCSEDSFPKVHKKSFEKLISVIGEGTSDIVLVDDRKDVIEMAENFGIRTILYDESVNLEESLERAI